MASRSSDVANRFSDLHPGFRLVDFEEAGLPFFELRLDVMAQTRHELPIVDEYVLRLASLGLRSTDHVSGFLGLKDSLVRRSVLSLLQADYVDYIPGQVSREITLTNSGRTVLEERVQQIPERTEIRIGFDRLLWRLSARWMAEWDNPRTFKEANARLVPPRHKRRPEVAEVDMVTLNRALADVPRARHAETNLDVLQILSLGARTKYVPALMLVFVADDNSAIRVSFIVDEHHSPDHDRAFEDIDGLQRAGISLADPGSVPLDRPKLPDDLEALRPDPELVANLDERLRSTTTALDLALGRAEADQVAGTVLPEAPSTREQLRAREHEVAALKAQLDEIQAERRALPVRAIPMYEHRVLLEDALDRTRSRLLIIAPWVTSSVVTGDFASKLERLAKTGVRIHIGYGIVPNDTKHDRAALDLLERLVKRYPNFILVEIGHTHAKVLVWDDSMVVTSFNWLSFRGDRHREYRQEEGTLINHAEYVDREYGRHRVEIEGP